MSYDHSLNATLSLKPGTSKQEVIQACEPIFEYFNIDGKRAFGRTFDDHEFSYNKETGELYIYTSGDAGDSYSDAVRDAAERLGKLVLSPGEFSLSNHDDPNLEDAISEIFVGQSDEAIAAYRKTCDIAKALKLLGEHFNPDQITAITAVIDQQC